VQVSGLTGVTAVAGGFVHSLALKSDGTVWAWGYNAQGQLGNETYTDSNSPMEVLGSGGVGYLTGVTAIAGVQAHSLALKGDGTVLAWGYNAQGELGNGTFTFGSNTPVQVSGLSGVTAIAGGYIHSLALKAATPSQLTNNLIGQVMSLGLSNGETTSLTAKLRAALGYLAGGDTADAIAALNAFINEVNALVNSGRLTAAAAAPLISAAEGIITAL
jgi:alpha-tubulin suppressor-like RCC1 family protein